MRLAGASIELDGEAAAGAIRFPAPGPAGRGIRIHAADREPARARVAVEYRGRWDYIADDDEASKQWFAMLQLLAGAQTPDTGVGPVLTIPVTSRW